MKRLVLILSWIAMLAVAPGARAQAADSTAADSAAVDSVATPAPAPADSVAAVDSVATPTPVPAPASALKRVNELEAIRRQAMVKSDTKTLANFFAEDMTYVHSTGLMQSRAELFRLLEKKEIRYVAFTVEKTAYRSYGNDTVVSTGVQRIELTSNGKPFTSYSRYTVVYALVGGEMKLVSYQSTSMPELTSAKPK